LRSQTDAATGIQKEYFISGKLQSEDDGNDLIKYNEQGKILENNKLRETKKKLDDELGSLEGQYVSSSKEIASLLKDKLSFDQTNSNFSSNILTKDNEYVLSAFKLLFNDYDKKSHELIDASNKAIKDLGYSESLSENNAKNDLNEQIKVYEIAINLYQQIIPINKNFINKINQFDTFLMSQDLKKINKSLKSVNTSEEVISVLKI
jgi:hypothetical protein